MEQSSYEDILSRSRPISHRHARMSPGDRAAQFAPFAALTGYGDVIEETARLTDSCEELSADFLELLDWKFSEILAHPEKECRICILYFVPDSRKVGGRFENFTGFLQKMDATEQTLHFRGGFSVPFSAVRDIEILE